MGAGRIKKSPAEAGKATTESSIGVGKMDYKSLIEKIEAEIKKSLADEDGGNEYAIGYRNALREVSDLIKDARKEDRRNSASEKAHVLKTYLEARYGLLDCFERDGEQWAVCEDEGYTVFAFAADMDDGRFSRAQCERAAIGWLEKHPVKDCAVRFDKICYSVTGEGKAFVKHIIGVGGGND